MSWHRIDRVQIPTALLIRGGADIAPVLFRLKTKSALFGNLHVARGEGWWVIFGAAGHSGEVLLPHIADAVPLYEAETDCWLPVGTALNIPINTRSDYMDMVRDQNDLAGLPLCLMPQFEIGDATLLSDVFAIRDVIPLSDIVLPEPSP